MAAKKNNARGSAHITTDHERIRAWVEERGGHPAVVKRTRGVRGPGILRIDFPGYSGEGTLEPMDWDEFFESFDGSQLAFLYQEETGSGRLSRFNKFVHRETMSFDEDARATRGRTGRRAAAKKTPSVRAKSEGRRVSKASGTRKKKTGTRRRSV